MSKSPLRDYLFEATESIDAGMFSGDGFDEPAARAELRRLMARWERELKLKDTRSASFSDGLHILWSHSEDLSNPSLKHFRHYGRKFERQFFTSDNAVTVPDDRDVPDGDAREEFETLLRTQFSEHDLQLYAAENLHYLHANSAAQLAEMEHKLVALLIPLGVTFIPHE